MNSSSRSEKSNGSSGGKSQSSVISIQIANEDDDNVVIQLFPNKKTVRRNDKKKSRHKMKRQAAGGNSCSCKSTSKKGNAKSDVSSNGCCSMYSNIYRTAFGPTIDETLLVGFETLKNLYVDDCNDSVLAEHGSITQDDEADQKRTGSEPEIESEYTSASTRPYVRDPQRRVLGRANADDTPTSKLMKKGSGEESKRPLSRGRSRRRSRSESSSSVGRPVSDSDTKSDKIRTSDKIVPSESSAEKDHTTDKIYHKKRKSLDHVAVDQIFPDDSETGSKKSSISTKAATVEDQKDRGIERSPRVSGKFAVLYPITDGVKRYSEKGVQKDMLSPKISNGSEKEYIVIDPLVVEQAIVMKRKSMKEDSKEDYLIIDPASIKQALSISKKSVDDVEKDTPDVPRKSRSSRDRHDSIDLNKQENGTRKNSVGIDQIRQSEDIKKNGSRTRVSEEGYIIIDPAILEQEVKRTELQKVFKDSGEKRDSTDSQTRKELTGSPRRSRGSRNNSLVLEDGDMKKKSIRESINNGKRQESDSQSKRESLGSPRGSKVSKHDSKESAEKMVIKRHSVDSQTKKDSLSKPRKSDDSQILEEDLKVDVTDDIRKDSGKTGDSLKGFIIVDPEIIAEAVALRKTLRTSNASEIRYSSNGNMGLRGSLGKSRVSTEGSTSMQIKDIPKKRESVEDGNDEIIGKKKEDSLSNLRKSRLSKDGYIVIDSDTFKRDSRDERKRSSTEKNGQNGRNSSTSRKSRASRDSKDINRKELEIIPEDSDTKTDEEAVQNEIMKDFRKKSSIREKSTSNNRGSLNDGKNGVRVNKDDNKDDTVEKLAIKIENEIQGNNNTDDKSESTSYSDESTESDDYSESDNSDEYSPDSDEKKSKKKNNDKPLSADSDYKSQSTANNNRRESRGSPKDSVNNMTDEKEVRNTILEDDPEKTKYSPEELKKLNKYVEITESEKRTKEFSPFDTKNEPYTGYFTVEHKRPNIKLYRYIYDSDSCAGRRIRVPYSSNTCRSMSTSKESNQNGCRGVCLQTKTRT